MKRLPSNKVHYIVESANLETVKCKTCQEQKKRCWVIDGIGFDNDY